VKGSTSALYLADHSNWHGAPDYNPDVKTSLTLAYARIKQTSVQIFAFREAGYHVVPFHHTAMCAQQRMNVSYILAMAYSADDDYQQALEQLDRSLLLAQELDDPLAQVDLLFLHGVIMQRIARFDQALLDYSTALALQAKLRREHIPVDREQELSLIIGAAGFALMQEDYELTGQLFTLARRVARHVPQSDLTVAYHDWLWAVYLHARGKSARALQVALQVADTFSRLDGNPHSIVLVYVFTARIALDIAATHAQASIGRQAHLKIAALCLRKATQARLPNNRSGQGYLLARQAYLDALSGRGQRARERIEAAERLAREVGDDVLLVQVLTAHGHVLAQRPDTWEAALDQYRQALDISEHSAFPLEGLPARRAVRQLEEMHSMTTMTSPDPQTPPESTLI
jgi:tetratricopeptide (TPR) repeat protein